MKIAHERRRSRVAVARGCSREGPASSSLASRGAATGIRNDGIAADDSFAGDGPATVQSM